MGEKTESVEKEFKYYDDFKHALTKIDKEYISFYLSLKSNRIEDENDPRVKFPERIFAYEFYHQYRRLMEDKEYGRTDFYKDKILNGEQEKQGARFEAIKGELDRFTPDLILHHSVSDTSGQYWICEIKMSHNPKPFDDLFKIGLYKECGVKFEYYIFLYVVDFEELGDEKAKMANYILKHKGDDDPKKAAGFVNETICFFYDPLKKDVQAEWLCNILLDAPKNTKAQ